MSDTITPILQFGTSRFLQAHADLFFSEAETPLTITVVQSSGDPARLHRLAALSDPSGFPVRIRGISKGKIVDEERRVTSVRRTLSTATDWAAVERVFCDQAKIILSNTGDTGYVPCPRDSEFEPHQDMSYPAKLFHLLAARFRHNAIPPIVMPMELVNENGNVLKNRVLSIGHSIGADKMLLEWIESIQFANSLVDRIVSEPIEPAGAIAEPYALWAIELIEGMSAPCEHPAVQLVPDLKLVENLKLYILNLGHTVLAHEWKTEQLSENMLVREIMEHTTAREKLNSIYFDEVLPGFSAMGLEKEARQYHDSTIERFCNPFLDHKLSDIAQNHVHKIERRIGAFLDWTSNTNVNMTRLLAIRQSA